MGFFGLCRFVWDSLIVVDNCLIVEFCLKMICFKFFLRFWSIFLLDFDMVFGGIWVILVIIVLICFMLIFLICFLIGINIWDVLILLIILIVLFGNLWLCMYLDDSLIVVLIVLFVYLILWNFLKYGFNFFRILMVFGMFGLFILIFWNCCIRVWLCLKYWWYFLYVVDLI